MELMSSNMSELDENEEKENYERVDIIELTLKDKVKDKISIDLINEKHFTSEEHNVEQPKTVAIMESTNPGSCYPFIQRQISYHQAVLSLQYFN